MMVLHTYTLLSCGNLLRLLFVVVRHFVGTECEAGDCGVGMYAVTRQELGDATFPPQTTLA